MESESSFSINTQALKVSAAAGMAAGICSIAVYFMIMEGINNKSEEIETEEVIDNAQVE